MRWKMLCAMLAAESRPSSRELLPDAFSLPPAVGPANRDITTGEKIMRVTRMGLAAALAATLFGAVTLGMARAAEPVKIRLSYTVPITDLPSILLEKKDLAKNLGKSYQLEVTRFVGTPLMITALAAGELDIADLAYSSLPLAIQNAGMNDLRIIADGFQDGNAGYYSAEYMVLADGPIRKIEELKGKVVATNAAGSGVDIAMRAMLHKSGLEDKRDYTVVEAQFPTMRAMLAERKVDLVPAVLPFSLDPELRKIGRPLFTSAGAVGVSQFTMWVARKGFIDRNRAAMVDFMEDTLRIVRWYLDPANRKQVMDICARITKQPPERFAWVFTDKDYYRDRNLLPDLAALQRNVDLTRDLGLIRASFDVAKFSDLSVVREAANRPQ
jgi:NitT/TauT family transport system substrate-binding protein